MSSAELIDVELRIKAKVNVLAKQVQKTSDGDPIESCGEVERLVAERNRKCKMLK